MSKTSLIESSHEEQSLLSYLQLFWANRRFLARSILYAALASVFVAFLIPVRYQSIARLMPPDQQSGLGLGFLTSMAGRGSGMASSGLSGFAGDLLGVKTSGALFVGVLGSESVQDRVIEKFQLKKPSNHGVQATANSLRS